MNVAFTGTRKGMSDAQLFQLRNVLKVLMRNAIREEQPVTVHHGGAVGADTQCDEMARELGFGVVVHPAYSEPLVRNRRMAMLCDVVIAAPEKDGEVLRSGTWATVRYARANRKPVVMLSRG